MVHLYRLCGHYHPMHVSVRSVTCCQISKRMTAKSYPNSIPEMATGWGSDLIKDEITFLIFDGAMVLVVVFLITIFHPANYFPMLTKRGRNKEKRESAIPLHDNAGSITSQTTYNY